MNTPKNEQTKRRGAIGVIVDTYGRLLVIKRSQSVRAPGRLCFPGGGIEAGESEEEAVKRELYEELNVRIEPVRRLWESETRSGVLLKWWLVELHKDQEPKPNPDEVAECYWLSTDTIMRHGDTLQTNREFLVALGNGAFTLDY